MLAAIVYSLGCFVIASVLTFLWAITRPIKMRDEMRSWRVLLFTFGLSFLLPYGYNETLTRVFGDQLQEAIEDGYARIPIDGPLQYYKVTEFKKGKARVLVVAQERQEWGGVDRPMVWIDLVKEEGRWRTDSYKIANSLKFNREQYIFPVYW